MIDSDYKILICEKIKHSFQNESDAWDFLHLLIAAEESGQFNVVDIYRDIEVWIESFWETREYN